MSHLTDTVSSPRSRNWSIMFSVLMNTWNGASLSPVQLATGHEHNRTKKEPITTHSCRG
jgi:hypothetical protein